MAQRLIGLRRRSVVAGLAGAALLPRSLMAQRAAKLRSIGILIGQGSKAQGQWRVDAFDRGLKKLGLADGQNVRVDYRWGEGDPAAINKAAEELATARMDVLVATNTPATLALRAATDTIPIVFVNITDPIGTGIVTSLTHPSANATGFTDMDPTLAGKWVELLKRLVPPLRTVAFVYNPDGAVHAKSYLAPFENAARQLGLTARVQHVKTREDYAPVLEACGREGGCAAILLDDIMFTRNIEHVVGLAREHKVPAMYTNQGYVVTYEGLIAYGVGLVDLYAQSMEYVDKILKGAKPADLPVQMPATFRLAVNLKTAAAVGIEVPTQILAIADRVVE